jgi:tetratricopeptide (TPR) repeat protein
LLESEERGVFRRLAVFANGAALVAAEQVCTAAGAIVGNMLEVLGELVDKSMAQRQELKNGEMRFWLLQTLREFGEECLSQAGEIAATQAAHAAYFLSWVERVAPMILGAEQADWLDQLDREYENVRVALEWMLDGTGIERGWAEQALRLCVALMAFWEIRGYIREGLAFMERALAIGKDAAPSVRAQALHYAGFLALMLDDNTRAEEFLRESQLLFRDSGDKFGMANILRLQGNLAMTKNNFKIARRLLEEALNIYRTLGDMRRAASTCDALAQVAIAQGDYNKALLLLEENLASYQMLGEQNGTAYPLYHMAYAFFRSRGDLAKARELTEESLALFRAVGNRRVIAYVLILLGEILLVEGEDDRARSVLEESLSIFRVMGERSGTASALIALARVAAYQGEYETALSFYQESWKLLQEIGDRELAAACLEGCGEVLVAQGEARWAVQLWGIAATVRAAIVAPMPPIYRPGYIQAMAVARESLSEEAFQAAWREGSGTPLEQGLGMIRT